MVSHCLLFVVFYLVNTIKRSLEYLGVLSPFWVADLPDYHHSFDLYQSQYSVQIRKNVASETGWLPSLSARLHNDWGIHLGSEACV